MLTLVFSQGSTHAESLCPQRVKFRGSDYCCLDGPRWVADSLLLMKPQTDAFVDYFVKVCLVIFLTNLIRCRFMK
jgi:hypothetical protein